MNVTSFLFNSYRIVKNVNNYSLAGIFLVLWDRLSSVGAGILGILDEVCVRLIATRSRVGLSGGKDHVR